MLFADPVAERPRRALLPPICVPIAQPTLEALLAHSAALLPEFAFQELRLDFLADPVAALPALRSHTQSHPAATFLATCRREVSGGQFGGSAEAEHRILIEAARGGCALVDLAIESAEALGPSALRSLQAAGAAVILSWHDFERAGDCFQVLERIRPFAPDFAKLVPTANTLCDNLPLLGLLQDPPTEITRLIGVAMGEAGVLSRVLGLRCGSVFTFAPATADTATATGQITASILRDLYRAPDLNAETTVYGVAGNPVRSSLSPLLLNTAFRETGINAVYVPLLTEEVTDLVQIARELPLGGFSVTMPHKQAILPFLDRIDPLAARIGAVNTVCRERDGTLSGFNTDAAGIVSPLQARLNLKGARILVLGAGGAARAAVFGCTEQGAEVSISNRTFASANALAAESGASALHPEELGAQATFDVLIHATPAGMRHHATPLPLELARIRANLVFDLVYNPLETPLLQAARGRGLEILHGVEMFLHQGAHQFELWTGQPAPIAAMRRVVLKALS